MSKKEESKVPLKTEEKKGDEEKKGEEKKKLGREDLAKKAEEPEQLDVGHFLIFKPSNNFTSHR